MGLYRMAQQLLRQRKQKYPHLPSFAYEGRVKFAKEAMIKVQKSMKLCKDTTCKPLPKVKVVTKRPRKTTNVIRCAPGYSFKGGYRCKPNKAKCVPITIKGCALNAMAELKMLEIEKAR